MKIINIFGIFVVVLVCLVVLYVLIVAPFRKANYMIGVPMVEQSGEIFFRAPEGRYVITLAKFGIGDAFNNNTIPNFKEVKISVKIGTVDCPVKTDKNNISFGVARNASQMHRIIWSGFDRESFTEDGVRIYLVVRPSW